MSDGNKRKSLIKLALAGAALLSAPIVGMISWLPSEDARAHSLGQAMGVVSLFALVLLGILQWSALGDPNPERKRFGFLQIVLGADGRVSTSKTIGALWTFVFAAALVTLSTMVWFGGLSVEQSFGGEWDAYMILLGGPFAAAVLAKGVTASKVASDPGAKTSTPAASRDALVTSITTEAAPSAGDIVRDDAGETSLADTQYVVFSLVALTYFVGSFIRLLLNYANSSCAEGVTTALDVAACAQSITLPQIPASILGLTSVAAITYVGNKATQTSGIRFADMHPNPAVVGSTVQLRVVNLVGTATQANTSVVFKKGDDDAETRAPEDEIMRRPDGYATISVIVPSEMGDYQVAVVTPDAVSAIGKLTVKQA